jgi:cell division protein FtsB
VFEYLKKYAALGLIGLLVAAAIFGYVKYRSYQDELLFLRNAAAEKDRTIEEQKGTYAKLARENDQLKSSNADLQKLYNRTKQDLIAESQLTAYWKGKYAYEVDHRPLPPGAAPGEPAKPGTCTEAYATYRGEQDIGLVKLTIDTTTLDPTYRTRLTVEPGSQPLKLTLNLTRDRNRQWRTYVVSSDERIAVDIGVNSVNLEPLDESWYERLKFHLDVGAGDGVLAGFGIAAQFGQFDVGPSVWGTTDGGAYYGVNFSWAPFKRK